MNSSLSEPLLRQISQHPNEEGGNNNNENDEPQIQEGLLGIEQTRKSRNINYTLVYTFVLYCGRSLWNQSVLPVFIFLIKDSNPIYVGVLSGIMGMAQIFASFPSGILADRYCRRDTMLKIGSVLGVLAFISTSVATMKENFVLLGVSLGIWGVFTGVTNPPLAALFADSIDDGNRSHYFTQRSMIMKLGATTAPVVALSMFYRLGDRWTIKECAVVMLVGQCICFPAALLLCLFSDDYCIPNDTMSVLENDNHCNECFTDEAEGDSIGEEEESSFSVSLDDGGATSDLEHKNETPTLSSPSPPSVTDDFLCIPSKKVIPIFIATADVMSGLSSGMSIRYFPIFFKENLNMSPEAVQVTLICANVMLVLMSKVSQKTSRSIGRVQSTLLFKYLGISSMVAMIALYQTGLPTTLIIVLYVFRTATMNSTSALTKSILMDEVPKNERAKWSAVESVQMFGWAGSAVVGGVLVDEEGILFNFYTTAFCSFLATIPLLFLLGKVKDER